MCSENGLRQNFPYKHNLPMAVTNKLVDLHVYNSLDYYEWLCFSLQQLEIHPAFLLEFPRPVAQELFAKTAPRRKPKSK